MTGVISISADPNQLTLLYVPSSSIWLHQTIWTTLQMHQRPQDVPTGHIIFLYTLLITQLDADFQCQQLDAKAREAHRLREEARHRRLMKAKNEWKINHVNEKDDVESPNKSDSCDPLSQVVLAGGAAAFALAHYLPTIHLQGSASLTQANAAPYLTTPYPDLPAQNGAPPIFATPPVIAPPPGLEL